MAFIFVENNITVNTQYIIKVKWKLSPDNDELSGSIFLAGGDKNEVVAVKGEPAYQLWDALHPTVPVPRNKFDEARVEVDRDRRKKW